MAGSLGEKVGEGAFAEVYAWAPGQVVKLLRKGFRRRAILHEARMTRAVFTAGGPAPQVFDEVSVDGRPGFVMARFDGPTLQHLSRTGAMSFEETGALLATLCLSVHRTRPPADVLFLRDHFERSAGLDDTRVPAAIATGVLALLDRLAPGDGLCHADLHSSNVIMTAEGPRIIDWTGAVRAPAVFDLACCQVLLSEIAPALVPDPERPIAVNAALQAAYAGLTGASPAALSAEIEPWLPVARAFALLGGAAPRQREQLIASLEASLRGAG